MPDPRIFPIPKTTKRTDALRRRGGPRTESVGTDTTGQKTRRSGLRPPAAAARVIPIDSAVGVRWPRVRTARARIAADFYERGEILDRVVDALLSEILHSA